MSTVQTMCENESYAMGGGWKYIPSRCGNSTDQFIIMYKMKSIKSDKIVRTLVLS